MAKTILKTEEVKIRRSPKYLQFLLTGAILGLIAGAIIGVSLGPDPKTGQTITNYLIAYLAATGAALGIIFAVTLDWIFTLRTKRATATKLES
jgi:xanthine/uracil permease